MCREKNCAGKGMAERGENVLKTLYLDCGMGAAGDMLLAALWELCQNREEMLQELNGLGLEGVEYIAEPSEKCGIVGTHMRVLVHGEEEDAGDEHEGGHSHVYEHEGGHSHEHIHEDGCSHEHVDGEPHVHRHDAHGHAHHHAGMAEIQEWILGLNASETVKHNALAVYRLIAEAESTVHGKTVEEIHFHEVGTLDAVADVTGVCLLMERLGIGQVFASAVHVGMGHVHCAHGILPVPAPATAYLLQGIPMYGGSIRGELCTPTGAALLKYFVRQFGVLPQMAAEKIGYGMGRKDFEAANCVRAMLGHMEDREHTEPGKRAVKDSIVELRCNLDDMSGEEIGYALEKLFEEGALDVYTAGIGMKKSRPGVLLVCLCRTSDVCRMEELIFRHTTTLGIRRVWCERSVLSRRFEQVETPWGTVRKKLSHFPDQEEVLREKLEYEDLAGIAQKTGLSIAEIRRRIGILY